MPSFRQIEDEDDHGVTYSSPEDFGGTDYPDYTSEEYTSSGVPPQTMYDAVVSQLEDAEKDEQTMSDVELRLEEANCYKVLLNNSLFTERS